MIYIPPAFPVCDDETPAVVAVVPAALPLAGRAFAVGPGSGWVLFGVDAVVEAVVFAVAHIGCLFGEARLSVHACARWLWGLRRTGLNHNSLPFGVDQFALVEMAAKGYQSETGVKFLYEKKNKKK